MSQHSLLRIKIPPTLRVNVITPKSLGDNPSVKITRPKNLNQPVSVSKTGTNQYVIVFDASSAGETVDITLTSAAFSIKDFFSGLLVFFKLSFWLGFLKLSYWTSFPWKTFLIRSGIVSGALFFVLVTLELTGVRAHKPVSKWLNTLTMAENAGDRIKDLVGWNNADPFFQSEEANNFNTRVYCLRT